MKITLTNGVIVELSGIDEITAVLPTLPGLGAMTAPAPEIEVPAHLDSPDDDEDEEAKAAASEILTALTKPASRRVRRDRIPNPPAPSGRWPEMIFLTEDWKKVLDALRSYHPERLSSEELAIELGIEHSIASGWVGRMRSRTPLVALVDGKFGLTEIGQDTKIAIQIADKPSIHNAKRGWNRFTARALPDGRSRHGKKK